MEALLKINFSWIKKDVYKFCIENNNWEDLSDYLEKKISLKNKNYKGNLSAVYYQISVSYYLLNEISNAQIFLKKALKLNNNFPPYMEFFCKLNMARNEKELIKVLKNYWIKNPNPNIEKCIDYAFSKKDNLSKVKIISIGPQTSISCRKCFNRLDKEATQYDLEGLLQACIKSIQS